jgi:hypothetical protein
MDKRATTRNRVLRPGTIQLDGGVTNCMVRNLSSTGAMLDVASAVGIPEHFTLVLRLEGHHIPSHRVAERKADRRRVRVRPPARLLSSGRDGPSRGKAEAALEPTLSADLWQKRHG